MVIEKLLLNPVRIRIMQYLTLHETATTSEIIDSLKNVPRATIYNHIKLLEEHGAICVVKENRIRGTVEKVFSVNKSDNESQSIINYLLRLIVDYQTYFDKENVDSKSDMLFVDRTLLYLNDNEFSDFFREYTDLCKKYYNYAPLEMRKARTISLISSPSYDDEK